MKMTADEKRWRAESDAETLARYQEIMQDSSRKKAAIKAANSKVADLTKRVDALKKATGGAKGRK